MTISRRGFLAGTGMGLMYLALPARAQEGRTDLNFGLSGFPPSFEPWVHAGTTASTVTLLTRRGLIELAPDGGLRGGLAETWSLEDGTVWTFNLRDAKFTNGAPVTAEDIKWNFEQVMAPESTAYLKTNFQNIESIETPDEKTVIVRTKVPMVTLDQQLATPYMPIVAKDSNSEPGAAIGAGPYRIVNVERGVSIELEAFEDYYEAGKPQIKTVRLIAYSDENLRVSALHSGDLDLIEYVPWPAMAEIEASPNLSLTTTNGPYMYAIFNGTKAPFNDPRVRKAIGHAMRRDDIVEGAFLGRGAPLAGTPISPGTPFYDEARANGWNYDLDLARSLLAEAGYPDGFSTTLLSTAQYKMHQDTAQVVQQSLADIGIQAELILRDWATVTSMGLEGQYDMAVMGTASEFNDPDGLTAMLDGSLPPHFTRSFGIAIPEITALLAEGRSTADEAARREIYNKLQDVVIEQAPLIGLAWRGQGYAMSKSLQGFTNLPGALTFFSSVTLVDSFYG